MRTNSCDQKSYLHGCGDILECAGSVILVVLMIGERDLTVGLGQRASTTLGHGMMHRRGSGPFAVDA